MCAWILIGGKSYVGPNGNAWNNGGQFDGKPCTDTQVACPDHSPANGACCGVDGGYNCCYPAQGGSSIEFNGRSCFAPNDGETGGPKECGSADDSDAAKGLVVDAVVAAVAAVSIYAVALF